MADLAVIALGLDASGMKAGTDLAVRALNSMEKEMDASEKKAASLQKKLDDINKKAEESSKQFRLFGDSTKGAASALGALGGPVGHAANQFSQLTSQVEGLGESFGLIGAAAAGAVAGVLALSGSLVKLTLDGVKLSDEMGDIAEGTGLTIDQVQRLAAAMKLAGEDVGTVERSFKSFQGLIQEAIEDPSGAAAHTLYRLGTSAQLAGKDVGASFLRIAASAKTLSETTEGAVAVNDLFGRSAGAMKRSADQLTTALYGNRDALEDAFILGAGKGVEAGQQLDTEINKLSNTWDVFTQNLAKGNVGDLISTGLDDATGSVITFGKALEYIDSLFSGSTYLQGLFGFAKIAITPFATVGQTLKIPVDPGRPHALAQAPLRGRPGEFFVPEPPKPPDKPGPKGPRDTSAEKAAQALAEALKAAAKENEAIRKKAADDFIKDMEGLSKELNELTAAAAAAARELPVLKDTTADIFHRLGLPTFGGAAAPPFTAGVIPGTRDLVPLRPDQILSEREARIRDELSGIFDDFVSEIIKGKATVGDAFKGLLLGIADTFATEFAKVIQDSLRDAFIKPLASWLEDALKSIFEGIDLKGVSKFFLTLGKSFVGFFAEGGTIPSGHWGITGERGPEVVYAGSSPMHVQPMGGGGAVTINFAISTPTGQVSQKTQDQIADSAARGIERASRLRGAR